MKAVTRSFGRTTAVIMAVGAVMLSAAETAAADTPNCTTADATSVMAGVSANMTAYLFTHPDVNNFFTGLQGQSKSSVARQTKTYLSENPQVRAELDAIRAPAIDLRNRCNIPLEAEISGVI
ncbi:heme-binding protein [Mycolicibacterium goodii]|uniref:Membrane protein n=1 Tax=Mycolicibacterium goodii TaxID=134601 RepID=A0A0K0X7I3_MYCGD|nr:membrane protein [Mycolicibacterium goodii]